MKKQPSYQMKFLLTSIGLAMASLGLPTLLAQEVAPSAPPSPVRLSPSAPPPPPRVVLNQPPIQTPQADEKPFSLDFRGGSVREFVEAVEKATKEPFNVIIPESAQDLVIPPVRVREVTLTPLLTALSDSSQQRKAVATGKTTVNLLGGRQETPRFEYFNTAFKFSPTPGSAGNMVWQLTVDKVTPIPEPPAPTPVARFYQLKPNLEAGLKVEDITTVAQTAWAMMKLKPADIPELKVHEESGILIAVGSEVALSVIDSVLRELPKKQAAMMQPVGALPLSQTPQTPQTPQIPQIPPIPQSVPRVK
jgi:hypothetical protein